MCMGEDERCVESGTPFPNGLLPADGPIMRALDTDRWLRAEERTAELIACIQPNPRSEEQRNAVADYVKRLIMKCFPCEVWTFGSVPLKTYLPDGDIDLTAFSHDQNLKDTWANQVRDMLESEEKNANAEFHVKDVQYIQAEVKIIKCLVENIVVDISFSQVGGLCTFYFLDKVDNLISQDHLFKRSIILIKAWCYYESRILGAHHGLISTYALETLVLYIFHVFNNSFHGPLEVLYRFLEFFSNFDWDNFCVSLWGPVPISSLPDVTAESPWKDSEKLLPNKSFLHAYSSVYAVFPSVQENNGQPFVLKHLNVIDPLRVNNNLGRSVSKGNFYRIRSAFAFGAKRLTKLLDCAKEDVIFEVNQFFLNTWKRHGSGHRPDAPSVDSCCTRLSTPDNRHDTDNYTDITSRKTIEENGGVDHHNISSRSSGSFTRTMPTKSELPAISHMESLKNQSYNGSLQVANQAGTEIASKQALPDGEDEKYFKAEQSVYDTRGRFFARTHSSPELTDAYGDVPSKSRRHKQAETVNADATSVGMDYSDRSNIRLESLANHTRQPSVEDTSFFTHVPSQSGHHNAASDSNIRPNSYHRNLVSDPLSEDALSTSRAQTTHRDEQDIVNMMASASLHGFGSSVHIPFNLNSTHLPLHLSPSFLTAMGNTQRSMQGYVPANMPLVDPSLSSVRFLHGFVSPQLAHYMPSIGLNSQAEDQYGPLNENDGSGEMNSREADNDSWQDQVKCSSAENGNVDPTNSNGPPPKVSGLKYVPPHRQSELGSSNRVQQKHSKGKRESARQNSDNFYLQDANSSEVYAEDRSTSSRFSSATRSNSLRSRTSSESSWDGSSMKSSKSMKEKQGKKTTPTELVTVHGKGKNTSEKVANQINDEQQWISPESTGPETVEMDPVSNLVTSMQVPGQHMRGYDVTRTSESDPTVSFPPVFINPGSRQRMKDNTDLIAFYPTGPPIPFLTMLPVYNIPPESGAASDTSSSHFGDDETLKYSESGQNYISEELNQSEDYNRSSSLQGMTTTDKRKSDILNSDFDSHLQNLQLGRLYQSPRYPSPPLYPSQVMVPPVYLQGPFPHDNAARPFSENSNSLSQFMTSYGHCLLPVTALQSVPVRPPNMYQQYMEEIPRHRSGTGTYLPNPKVTAREHHMTGTRRGSYYHDRIDGDREGNSNGNYKSRASSRSNRRHQNDKPNLRADRTLPSENRPDSSWDAHRHEAASSYSSHNSPERSTFRKNGPESMGYSTYPSASTGLNGISNGPLVPPVVMMYPFDHNAATNGSHSELYEFGSLGRVGFPGMNEQLHLNEGTQSRTCEEHRPHGSSRHQSSPKQLSSPPSP